MNSFFRCIWSRVLCSLLPLSYTSPVAIVPYVALLPLSYTSPFCPLLPLPRTSHSTIVIHVTARSCYATMSQSFVLAEHLLDSSARICGCYLQPVMMLDNLGRNLFIANNRVFCTGQALLLCFLPERYLNYDKSCVFRYRSVVL